MNLDAAEGDLEVVTGNTAYEADGTLRWTSTVTGDGYPAVADFDGDGSPEIVVVFNGTVAILRADGTAYVPPLALSTLRVDGAPITGRGGAPTIADIDGDTRPEIGLAMANAFYEGDGSGTLTLLDVVELGAALPPGGVERVSLVVGVESAGRSTSLQVHVVVDDDGAGAGRFRECDETNNATSLDVACVGLL